ncbi:g753 [Coccomyxa viridis]|uniref:G753 protein n=1 Tax=Coccomyxa viridis TaxID=1274662 RepID=A0ABP1FLR0_9CHLO
MHELTADSSDKPSKATPDRRLRSQRWRSVAELAAEDESSPATALDPLQWDSLSAIPKTHTADVPDLDWLLELNGLAQTAALPVDAVALEISPLQPPSSGISSGAFDAFLSEALQTGQLSDSGAYDLGDRIADLGRAYTAPEPLPDPFMIAAEGIATPRAHQVSRAGSASDATGREKLCDSTWQGALCRGSTFNDMEMYKLLLETPHHPEGSGQPVDWDLLFGGPATSLSAAAQPRPVQAEAGQAGHVWPGKIIRGPLQDFAVDPGTGQKLKFGKAMQARASQVELPSVAALFADISSNGPGRQHRWSPRTPGTPGEPPHVREGSRQISRRAAATVSPPSGQSALTFGPQLSGHGEGSDQKEAHIGLMKTTSGFGGITRGVIQAASMGGKRRAPVMRLEELHQMYSERKRFRGVSRSPWSLTWDSHVLITASSKEEREVFLGSFSTENTAAKAHDVAALRLQADHASGQQVETNFPHVEYQDGLVETGHKSIADFIVALQRHGAFESQSTSRYRGVDKVGENSWQARFELDDAAISNRGTQMPEALSFL